MSSALHEVVSDWCALPRELHDHFERLRPVWAAEMSAWRADLRRIEAVALGQRQARLTAVHSAMGAPLRTSISSIQA